MPTTLSGLQKPGHQWAYIANSEPAIIAETLVAFANSDGGWLVLGVDADGVVGALRTDDEMADAVRAAERLCVCRKKFWFVFKVPLNTKA